MSGMKRLEKPRDICQYYVCSRATVSAIVVINVGEKMKNVKNAFFIVKIKKTFANVIKNVTLFFTCV